MHTTTLPIMDGLDLPDALRVLVQGTAAETGDSFFSALVQNLAAALHTQGAWVTEYLEDHRQLKALAFWLDGGWVPGYAMDIAGTPCEAVIDTASLVHFPDRLVDLYPHDPDLRANGWVSYLGVPLKDVDGRILGHLAVIDRRPMPADPQALALFQIFAARAAAELRRLRAERGLREREETLARVVGSVMDAIVELDETLCVTLMNPAAEKLFRCSTGWAAGQEFGGWLTRDGAERLLGFAGHLGTLPAERQSGWIPGGLEASRVDGGLFRVEATISRFASAGRPFYTLVLRDANERAEAERRIHSLTAEREYLREELSAVHGAAGILGRSPALRRVLGDVRQVAETDATVLIQGETGTGKELFARAIHSASPRREKAMITVNCAAIPGNLIESEFFGHEKGAFTGATARREGRFALADGGTIFLDEVGELPLELQGKLLRVLQEGSFDPVGGSRTRRVDVRVVAATNRDLATEVKEGRFREDLFYRLNVFPITLPPLRRRAEDIPVLAEAFAQRFARKLRRSLLPLTEDCVRRLQSYPWPGNVRELENVMERAVITARDGRLNLARAIPETVSEPQPPTTPDHPASPGPRTYTAQEMEQLERANLFRVLENCGWKISGDNGAASRLGMKPSTLTSRLKALGVTRPGI